MNLPIIDLDSQHSCYLFSLLRKEEYGKTLEVYTPETLKEIKRILENFSNSEAVKEYVLKRLDKIFEVIELQEWFYFNNLMKKLEEDISI